jgi:hypothetical protein
VTGNTTIIDTTGSTTVTVTANAGYTIGTVTASNGTITGTGPYTLSNVTANTTVTATFTVPANGNISITNNTDFYIIDIKINGTSVSTIQPGQGYPCNSPVADLFSVAPGSVSVYVAIGTWNGSTRNVFYSFGPANYTVSSGQTTSLSVTKKRARILANENDAGGQWFTATDFCGGGALYDMAYNFRTDGTFTLYGRYSNYTQYGIETSSGYVDGWDNLSGHNSCLSGFCSPQQDFQFCIHNTSAVFSLPAYSSYHPARLNQIYGASISATWGGTIYVNMGCSTGYSSLSFFAVSSKPAWVP